MQRQHSFRLRTRIALFVLSCLCTIVIISPALSWLPACRGQNTDIRSTDSSQRISARPPLRLPGAIAPPSHSVTVTKTGATGAPRTATGTAPATGTVPLPACTLVAPATMTTGANHNGILAGSPGTGFNAQVGSARSAYPIASTASASMPVVTSSTSALLARRSRLSGNSPFALNTLHDINFGTAAIGYLGGTITAPPIGAPTCTGSVIMQPTAQACSAEFQLSGNSGTPVSILLPAQVLMTRVGGDETLLVDAFTYEIHQNTLNVGATLHLPPNIASGPYSGEYLITLIWE